MADTTPPRGESLIDRDSHFTGTYRTPHNLRIEGRYEGEIDCKGTVYVGETAVVNARIVAGNVTVAGQLEGEIACDSRFEILRSGRVTGSVTSAVTVVHEGAFYQGELRMVRAGAPDRLRREPAAAPLSRTEPPARPPAAPEPPRATSVPAQASAPSSQVERPVPPPPQRRRQTETPTAEHATATPRGYANGSGGPERGTTR
jgi:cytoskeletal protein CcmA (bactofilin family)